MLDKGLKAETEVAKDQYKLFKDQKCNAIDNNRENGGIREEKNTDESNNTERFDAVLQKIKNNVRVDESLNIKSRDSGVKLFLLI